MAKAAQTGPLSEGLKWGQPAWRPVKARMGSTLRLSWRADAPTQLDLFVDCKTDLAARITRDFPDAFDSDARRRLTLQTTEPMPDDALWHLARRTFTYHRDKPA